MSHIIYKVKTEVEADGRWIAEVLDLPGVLAYGSAENEAVASAQALALRVPADRIEQQKEQKEPADTVTVLISVEADRCEPLARCQGRQSLPPFFDWIDVVPSPPPRSFRAKSAEVADF